MVRPKPDPGWTASAGLVHYSLVLASFLGSVLQVMESWLGLGNEASLFPDLCHLHPCYTHNYDTNLITFETNQFLEANPTMTAYMHVPLYTVVSSVYHWMYDKYKCAMHSPIMKLEYLQQVAKHDVPLPPQSQGNAHVVWIHCIIIAL